MARSVKPTVKAGLPDGSLKRSPSGCPMKILTWRWLREPAGWPISTDLSKRSYPRAYDTLVGAGYSPERGGSGRGSASKGFSTTTRRWLVIDEATSV